MTDERIWTDDHAGDSYWCREAYKQACLVDELRFYLRWVSRVACLLLVVVCVLAYRSHS